MQNQRLLYSESKRVRAGSINKENNIKLFNDSIVGDSLGFNSKKVSGQLRFDYENCTRLQNRSMKTVSEELTYVKPVQKSPLRRNVQNLEDPRIAQISSNLSSKHDPLRKNPLLSSQQQIESYTNKLLQNNQLYQEEIFQLKQDNAKIRSQLEKSIAQNIKFRMAAEKKEQEIKENFNLEISKLVRELKEILMAKEEMEHEYNKYIEELMQEHAKEMQGREQNFNQTEEFFKQKLSNLKNHLSLNKEEKEKQYFEASECKLRLMKEIDELNYTVEREKNEKRQLNKSNEEMVKIIKKLEKDLKETKQSLQKTQVEVFKIEKDKNQIIIQLKNQNKSLCDGVKDLQTKIQELDRSLSKKQNQFSRLENEIFSMKKELDEKTKGFIEKNLELQNSKNFRKQLEEQNNKLSETLIHQKSNFESLIQELQTSIRTLSSELSETQIRLKESQKQNTKLTSKIQSLDKQNAKITEEMGKLEELSKKYKKDNIQFFQELELLSLENKSMKEDKVLKDNHLRTLQQMCEQLQKSRGKQKDSEFQKIKWLQENQRIEAAKIREANNSIAEVERLMRKKYESQISQLKEENASLNEEIEQIVREYERKLNEKEQKWQLRVENIEKDLQNLLNADQGFKKVSNARQQRQERYFDRNQDSANIQKYLSGRKQGRSPYITKNRSSDDEQGETFKRPDILQSLTRRDAIRNKYQDLKSPKQHESIVKSERRQSIEPYNQDNSFRKRDTKYYEDIERRLNEFSNSRKLYH